MTCHMKLAAKSAANMATMPRWGGLAERHGGWKMSERRHAALQVIFPGNRLRGYVAMKTAEPA